MKKVSLNIKGMSCEGCVKKINSILSELNGIENYEVNLKKKNADITYSEAVTNYQEIYERLKQTTFIFSLQSKSQKQPHSTIYQKFKEIISIKNSG